MKEVLLIKNGELALKGLNRRTFEDMLIKNMKHRLSSLGKFNFNVQQSTIIAEPEDEETDLDAAVEKVGKIFGIAAFSRAVACEKNFETILRKAAGYLEEDLECASTFKVEAKRSDKKFPLTSPEICNQAGGFLLERFPHLSVDVHNPDIVVNIEIRDTHAYIHGRQIKGAGGMPTGSAGRALLLISGGIDSPVAGYMMAKRGLSLSAVHFASPPYTGEKAEQKVHQLLSKVAAYSGRIGLWVVHFTEIQESIKDFCPEDIFTVIMRRMMMRAAQIIAARENAGALITGESVGQVASQTMPAIACTDKVCEIPVFRPLIGMDKDEVIDISRNKTDTFDLSILPYEDCCTVFTPKHPRTRPTLDYVERAEEAFDWKPMVEKAAETARLVVID
ncbi:MAG: tRNA 4-thiouridine(8) synthase ThiI [Clostridia bacterium]|nr:tRNA 4-thiouridine(8) synthase ThiI [Clostridia bacterium]MBR4450979.1 tRNA 4-thiouridine(8) synthase ThiI [Clostridia bacterium]